MFFCIPLLLKNTSRREIPISFFISHLSQVYPEGVSERGPYTVPANAAGRVQRKTCYFFKIHITFTRVDVRVSGCGFHPAWQYFSDFTYGTGNITVTDNFWAMCGNSYGRLYKNCSRCCNRAYRQSPQS